MNYEDYDWAIKRYKRTKTNHERYLRLLGLFETEGLLDLRYWEQHKRNRLADRMLENMGTL